MKMASDLVKRELYNSYKKLMMEAGFFNVGIPMNLFGLDFNEYIQNRRKTYCKALISKMIDKSTMISAEDREKVERSLYSMIYDNTSSPEQMLDTALLGESFGSYGHGVKVLDIAKGLGDSCLLVKNGKPTKQFASKLFDGTRDVIALGNADEIFWIMDNSVRLLVNFDNVNTSNKKWKPDHTFFKRLDECGIEAFLVDVSIKGQTDKLCVRLCKTEYDRRHEDGTTEGMWNYNISVLLDEKEAARIGKEGRVATVSFFVFDELYPRKMTTDYEYCSDCNLCRDASICAVEKDGKKVDEPAKVVGNLKLRTGSKCKLQNVVPYDIKELEYACLYAINKFLTRKTVVKNSDKYVENLNKEVKVALRQEKVEPNTNKRRQEYRFVNLKDSVTVERKKGYKHASHKSPIEHTRRATTRTLKSGKVVPVSGSIVNKGKGRDTGSQTIYRVKD